MKKSTTGWTTFPTAIGTCGLGWNELGLTSFSFPEKTTTRTQRVLKKVTGQKTAASSLPPWIKKTIAKIKTHLKGDAQDFSDIPVHFNNSTELSLTVYSAIQKIPAGQVMTYGELAAHIGKPKASRAVGTALGKNPIPLVVPCHRVVASSGKLGGFSAPGGVEVKIDLLEREGVCLTKPVTLLTQAHWQKAVRTLQKQDKHFQQLTKKVAPFRFQPNWHNEPLTSLIAAIVSQQLSTKVATVILKRVNTLIEKNGAADAETILNTPEADLRQAGLSFMKISFLKDLAQHCLDGKLSSWEKLQQMSNEQIIKEFTRIKGVGRWTVEMYLIFNLGRADVFPVDDFGIRKAIGQLHGLKKMPSAHDLEKYGDHWKPYRSVASLYLWRSLDNA